MSGNHRIKRGLVLDTYPPLRVGVKPNSVHSPTDMSRELSTVTTAARARPHFDFTMSIFPEKQNAKSLLRSRREHINKKPRGDPQSDLFCRNFTCCSPEIMAVQRLKCRSHILTFPKNCYKDGTGACSLYWQYSTAGA
uniref:Uncharacterized protein n=1 Tax=Anas platyrhynchos TaxID=8839 RepID=A0A8B9SRX7_ANAPL